MKKKEKVNDMEKHFNTLSMKTKYIKVAVSDRKPKIDERVIIIFNNGDSGSASIGENGYWYSFEHESECDEPDFWLEETPDKQVIKGQVTVTFEEQELALSILQEIAYGNGFFNRFTPERYDAKWVNIIGPYAKAFFDANPELLTDDNIEEICCGKESEVMDKYGGFEGFNNLHYSLNNYFNNH